jgi:hypothetical protein
MRTILLLAATLALPAATSYADTALLRTAQALDEARGYCLDIRGEGASAQLDAPLQAHTCKYGAPLPIRASRARSWISSIG